MTTRLLFATGNPNKVREVNEMLKGQFEIESLKDIGFTEDIPETMPTIQGNALLKARFVKDRFGLDCFAEDTGLEVDALNGEPGVYTARYAGPAKNHDANMDLLLQKLGSTENRGAQFRTVIALILNGEELLFEGIARGTIAHQKSGVHGFGYDPVFIPEGYEQTFSEMSAEVKHGISHRGKAVRGLIEYLKQTETRG